MSSSRMCTIQACKRSAGALCYCCQEHICVEHLNQHSNLLNDQLLPLGDNFNLLFDQFDRVALPQPIFGNQIEHWRAEAHRTIDAYCERKINDFDELINDERKKQKLDLDQLRNNVNELIRNQEVTKEHIASTNACLSSLQHQIRRLEVPPNLPPLTIDDRSIDIYQNISRSRNLLPLPPPCRTIKMTRCSLIAASDDHFLLENWDKFYLLDRQLGIRAEIPWPGGGVWKLVWSRECARFILIASKKVFMLDETTLKIEQCPIPHDSTMKDWSCGACCNENLFIGIDVMASSIHEYKLGLSIAFVKEHRSPFTCAHDELLFDISSNNQTIALVITNREDEWRVDVCSPTTFGRYWSIKLGVNRLEVGIRGCMLNSGDLMIVNGDRVELVHVNTNRKLIDRETPNTKVIQAAQFANDFIAILSQTDLSLFSFV